MGRGIDMGTSGQGMQDQVEISNHLCRMQSTHGMAAIAAHRPAHQDMRAEFNHGIDEALLVAHGNQRTVHAIAQMLARCRVVESHGRHGAGQGFQGHVAEGFAHARENEYIATGKMTGEVSGATDAAEDEVGVVLLQAFALGAVANPHEAGAAALTLQFTKRPDRKPEVFLRSNAPDMDQHDIVLACSPGRAQVIVSPHRIKHAGIDRARQAQHTVEPFMFEKRLQLARRHQGGIAHVVEMAHPAHGCPLQEAQAVVTHVVIEAGVEPGCRWNAKLTRGAQCRPAQGAFRGHIDGIRPPSPPMFPQAPGCRQPKLQSRVERQAGTTHQHAARNHVRVTLLAWANHVQFMPAQSQAVFEALDGKGHAVDFRWIGLADDGVAHARLCRYRKTRRAVSACCMTA